MFDANCRKRTGGSIDRNVSDCSQDASRGTQVVVDFFNCIVNACTTSDEFHEDGSTVSAPLLRETPRLMCDFDVILML